MWKRISRIYQAIATITLNIMILFVVLLLISDKIVSTEFDLIEKQELTQNSWQAVGINHPYSGTFDNKSYFFSDEDHAYQVGLEYDRLAAEGHWQIHPWTGLTLRHFRGRFLNIDTNGFRYTTPPAEADADKPSLRIWMFGGSTLFGWGLADDYTLSSQLQSILQETIRDRQIQVSNFGIPWYYSSHELALLSDQLRVFDPPDMIIFLDGLNEIQYLRATNNQLPLLYPLTLTWESQIAHFTQPDSQPWITLNPSFPPNRIARQLGLNVPYEDFVSHGSRYAQIQTVGETIEENLEIAVQHYYRNQRMIVSIAGEYDITPFLLLQPLPFWHDDPVYTQFRDDLNNTIDSPHFYDITDAFEDVDPDATLLVDKTHYSDLATFILAKHISNIIIETYTETTDKTQ